MAENAEKFNWALVKSFVAVLDAGSLMGAARKLKAQQPTLSRHITELEAQLKVPLFERTGRGVVPTMAALAIADAARQMEEGAGTLLRALAQRAHATMGMSPSFLAISDSCAGRTMRTAMSASRRSRFESSLLATSSIAMPGSACCSVASTSGSK